MSRNIAISALILLISINTQADWNVQAKLMPQQIEYKLTINDTLKGDSSIGGMGIGVSAIHSSGWFLDVENTVGDDPVEGFNYEDYDTYTDSIDNTVSRNDTSVSIGHSEGGVSIFAGYKLTETSVGCGECVPDTTRLATDFRFTTSGIYLGAAKTFQLAQKHYSTLSIALGQMSAQYRPEINGAIESKTGTSFGYGFTASYLYAISSNWMLSTGLKQQSYSYSGMSAGDTFDVDSAKEEFSTLFFKAAYTF